MPANRPREREYVRTSARKVTSVSASASRPFGPAAADASAPSFTFAAEDRACAAVVHNQENKVCGLAAELKSKTGAFEGHHCRRAPGPAEVVAAAASHGATAVAPADSDRAFDDRRHYDHAYCLVEQVLRNIVGNIENFLYDHAGIFKPTFFLLIVCLGGGRDGRALGGRSTQLRAVKKTASSSLSLLKCLFYDNALRARWNGSRIALCPPAVAGKRLCIYNESN